MVYMQISQNIFVSGKACHYPDVCNAVALHTHGGWQGDGEGTVVTPKQGAVEGAVVTPYFTMAVTPRRTGADLSLLETRSM